VDQGQDQTQVATIKSKPARTLIKIRTVSTNSELQKPPNEILMSSTKDGGDKYPHRLSLRQTSINATSINIKAEAGALSLSSMGS
jgi:hypothetical protein